MRSDQSVFRLLGDKQSSNAQIQFSSTKRRKTIDKPSKNNRRIGDCIHEEIPMQATLQNNYYKARNISDNLISDVLRL